MQNCSNFDAGVFGGGLVSFCGESGVAPPVCGVAPPVCGAAAPPCAVPGADGVAVVCVCAGVGLAAGAVDVLVVVVVVVVVVSWLVRGTEGVLFSPGTVSSGAAVGRGADAFSLFPPPHPAAKGTSVAKPTTIATRK